MKKLIFLFLATQLLTIQASAQYDDCDVNHDGQVNTADVVAVYNAIINGSSGPVEPIEGQKTFTVNGVSFTMIAVEGGTFQMGATPEHQSMAYSDEYPVHQVTLSSFYLGQTEVTQELWQAVMGFTPNPEGYQWRDVYGLGPKIPAYFISYENCQEFCQKLNELTGQKFRLPTESEWEYAARGGKKSNGYKYAGSDNYEEVAWYIHNSSEIAHEVATKLPNELGFYDMSGNLWEWCYDWFGEYPSTAQTNPTGPETGTKRVYRGGSHDVTAGSCRVAHRLKSVPTLAPGSNGLRLAL